MLLIENIGQLITFNGKSWKDLSIIKNTSIIIKDNIIFWIGSDYDKNKVKINKILNANGNIIIPGLIDCHTHIIFAGNRSNEFAKRARGDDYLNIMKNGGGILNTVEIVRKTSKQELIDLALPRLNQMLKLGVTTIEAKSGYGLNMDDELKILEVIDYLNKKHPIDIEATFLGAHVIPMEHKKNKKIYIENIIKEILPAVAQQKIAKFCDIFVEKNAFNISNAREILLKAKSLGLICKIHAKQLTNNGGINLAAEMGVISASHLEFINNHDINLMYKKKIIAEILPISQLYLGLKKKPPIKELIKSKVKICVATDFNPGSSMSNNIQLALRLAVVINGLTCEESLLGITKNAACALNRDDIGIIKLGAKADFCILNTNNLWRLFSDWNENVISIIFKSGKIAKIN